MDANMHHTQWNPAARHNTHPRARDLIKICGTAGFTVMSERGVPMYYPRQNRLLSTIDLTWGNWSMTKMKPKCKTLTNTFGSDHQALQVSIPKYTHHKPPTQNTANLKTLDPVIYQTVVENRLSLLPSMFETVDQATSGITQITTILTEVFLAQGKTIKDNKHQEKAWWKEDLLRPLIQNRNRARHWMVLSRLQEAEKCYWNWQAYVKRESEKLKRRHWRTFLANTESNLTFKVLSYTLPNTSGSVAPLYRDDRTVATDKEEQAELLFLVHRWHGLNVT